MHTGDTYQLSTTRLHSRSTSILVFLNDLPTIVTNCTINLYADDPTIYYANRDPDNVTRAINTDLQLIATWIESNKMTMNVSKTQVMILSRRAARSWAELINVQINGTTIPKQKSIKYLEMTIDNDRYSIYC